MLVLARKVGERIFINEDIIISIEHVKGDNVRVGIHAPKDYRIYREELKDRQHEFKSPPPSSFISGMPVCP